MDARRKAFEEWWHDEDNLLAEDSFMCDIIPVWNAAWDAAMKEAAKIPATGEGDLMFDDRIDR